MNNVLGKSFAQIKSSSVKGSQITNVFGEHCEEAALEESGDDLGVVTIGLEGGDVAAALVEGAFEGFVEGGGAAFAVAGFGG